MAVTISTEVAIYRATTVATRTKIVSWTEASVGNEEASYTIRVAPNSTEVIPMAGVAIGSWIMVDAKPDGGTADVDMVLQLINSAASGVASGTQDIRFGSRLVICDSKFTAVSIKNLSVLAAVDVQIKLIGD